MKSLFYIYLALITASITILSCKKYSDPPPIDDPKLDSIHYCNDPKAINYNWGFPGTPDNSLCVYPADIWPGEYTVTDSVYSEKDSLISTAIYDPVKIERVDYNYINLNGICGSNNYKLLCTRYLDILTDTVNEKLYDYCGTDTFAISGSKATMDTTFFELHLRARNTSDGYHIMSFTKK